MQASINWSRPDGICDLAERGRPARGARLLLSENILLLVGASVTPTLF